MISRKRTDFHDCFKTGAAFVLGAAKAEIFRRNQQLIDVGHVLLGALIYERSPGAPKVCHSFFGDKTSVVVSTLDRFLGHGPDVLSLNRGNRFTEVALNGLCWALEIARRVGSERIDYYHLLLGIMETEAEVSRVVLNSGQTSLEAFRRSVACAGHFDYEVLVPRDCDVLIAFEPDIGKIRIPAQQSAYPVTLPQ